MKILYKGNHKLKNGKGNNHCLGKWRNKQTYLIHIKNLKKRKKKVFLEKLFHLYASFSILYTSKRVLFAFYFQILTFFIH